MNYSNIIFNPNIILKKNNFDFHQNNNCLIYFYLKIAYIPNYQN